MKKYLNWLYKITAVHLHPGFAEPFPVFVCMKAAASPAGFTGVSLGARRGRLRSITVPCPESLVRLPSSNPAYTSKCSEVLRRASKCEGKSWRGHDLFLVIHFTFFHFGWNVSSAFCFITVSLLTPMKCTEKKHLQVWKKYCYLTAFADLLQCKEGQS